MPDLTPLPVSDHPKVRALIELLATPSDGTDPRRAIDTFVRALNADEARAVSAALADPQGAVRLMAEHRLTKSSVGDLLVRLSTSAGDDPSRRNAPSRTIGDRGVGDRGLGDRGVGDRGLGDSGVSAVARGLAVDTRLVPRCREYLFKSVPRSYTAFEQEIMGWISTCVQSRSDSAHREVALVQGNPTLAGLYPRLVPGRSARIVPTYLWGPYQAAFIAFWSPDAVSVTPPTATRGPNFPAPASPPEVDAETHPTRPVGPRDIIVKPFDDLPRRGPIHLPVVDDPSGVIEDARKLIDLLRRAGKNTDADAVESFLNDAIEWLASVVALVGPYIFGVRYRAGRLVFQWAWNAWDGLFERKLARAEYPISRLEEALRGIAEIAIQHADLVAGSGITWKVLGEIIDPTVPAQIDWAACGPACVQMLLADRGIQVAQEEIVRDARAWATIGIKKQRVGMDTLVIILREHDPTANWKGGELTMDGVSPLKLAKAASQSGPWIAYVGQHNVVVDGFDSRNNVLIRDPYPPGGFRKSPPGKFGTRYRVPWKVFEDMWGGGGIFNQQ